MRRLIKLAPWIALLVAAVIYARRLNTPLEVRAHEDWMAYAVHLRGESLGFASVIDWREGDVSPSFFLNYLPESRVDWWESLLAFSVVHAPLQDEMVQIRTHDGALREWWVSPEDETFCFGESTRNLDVPFHRHETGQAWSGCPYSDDPRAARRMEFVFDGVVHQLREAPSADEFSVLSRQYRDLEIRREGELVYQRRVDDFDESFLFTPEVLATGRVVRIPHGYTRFQYFDEVEVIDWRTGESQRIAVSGMPGKQVPAAPTWIRVGELGELRLGGIFDRADDGQSELAKVDASELVLVESSSVETVATLSFDPRVAANAWGQVDHDWIEVDDRILVVQASLVSAASRELRVDLAFAGSPAIQVALPGLLGESSAQAFFDNFELVLAPDQDGDGIDDVLCVATFEDAPSASHVWWFHSGATGQLLKR